MQYYNNYKETDIVYKCEAHPTGKVFTGLTSQAFKERHSGHLKSFRNEKYSTETTLSKHQWVVKNKTNQNLILQWSIIKSVPSYSNVSKKMPSMPARKIRDTAL